MAYMNPLETKEEITAYKEWLSNKQYHFLKCLLSIFNMHVEFKKNQYPHLELRIELVKEELQKKESSI